MPPYPTLLVVVASLVIPSDAFISRCTPYTHTPTPLHYPTTGGKFELCLPHCPLTPLLFPPAALSGTGSPTGLLHYWTATLLVTVLYGWTLCRRCWAGVAPSVGGDAYLGAPCALDVPFSSSLVVLYLLTPVLPAGNSRTHTLRTRYGPAYACPRFARLPATLCARGSISARSMPRHSLC